MKTCQTIVHAPTNAYLLNTHALHNYQVVFVVIPKALFNQIGTSLVVDHQSVCTGAAKIIQSQKKAKSKKADNAHWNHFPAPHLIQPVPPHHILPLMVHPQYQPSHFLASHPISPNHPHHLPILVAHPQYHQGHFVVPHPIPPSNHPPPLLTHLQHQQAGPSEPWLPTTSESSSGTGNIPAHYLHSFNVNERW